MADATTPAPEAPKNAAPAAPEPEATEPRPVDPGKTAADLPSGPQHTVTAQVQPAQQTVGSYVEQPTTTTFETRLDTDRYVTDPNDPERGKFAKLGLGPPAPLPLGGAGNDPRTPEEKLAGVPKS